MCAQTFRLAVAFSIGLVGGTTQPPAAQAVEGPWTRALQFFRTMPPGDPGITLAAFRPVPLSAADRARAIALLPATGELRPTAAERTKLASVEPILQFHDRMQIIEIKVIDVPQAAIALYARSIVLASRPALRELSAAELQAIVAHEMGHELFWAEYEQARERKNTRVLQEIELKCDGVAVVTMLALRLDLKMLESAMRKLTHFNERIGATANADGYPDLRTRVQFVRNIVAMRAQTGGSH
jgi:hypothetical protein